MLPCVPDERPVPQEVLQGEVVHVGPRGRTLPGDLQPPGVEPDGSGGHPFRRVWFDCGVGEKNDIEVFTGSFETFSFLDFFSVFRRVLCRRGRSLDQQGQRKTPPGVHEC